MKKAVLKVLKKIPQEDFATALMSLPIRWMKCVMAEGEYFEGRHLPCNPSNHDLEIVFGEDSETDPERDSDQEGGTSEADPLQDSEDSD